MLRHHIDVAGSVGCDVLTTIGAAYEYQKGHVVKSMFTVLRCCVPLGARMSLHAGMYRAFGSPRVFRFTKESTVVPKLL